jgi:HK97 gp10 family phage protein
MGEQRQISIKISGMEDFEKTLKQLPEILQKKVVLQGFRVGAEVVKDRAVELAPRSRSALSTAFAASARQSGGKKHLHEKISVSRPRIKDLRSDREIIYTVKATHPLAFIAEYGTGPRVRKKSGGSTGSMPAFAFMRRAVDEKGTEAINAITEKCRTLLNAALERVSSGKYKGKK